MNFSVAGFEWDEGNWPKCGKHGVTREEIEALFASGPAVYADPEHSLTEQRLRAIGTTEAGRWLLVAFAQADRSRNPDPTRQRPLHAPARGGALWATEPSLSRCRS